MHTSSVPARTPVLTATRGATITLVVATIFFVSSQLSTFWATDGRASMPIFPGVGAALAALLLYGPRYWPAIFLGRLLAFVAAGTDLAFTLMLAISAANAAGGVGQPRGCCSAGADSTRRCHACATCCGSASAADSGRR